MTNDSILIPGTIVKIKKQYQDEGGDRFTFVVKEDRDSRVLVEVQGCLKTINPTQSILKEYLEDL